MKICILACVLLIMIKTNNCVAHTQFDQVIYSSSKITRLTTATNFSYFDLKVARKVCTPAKGHCQITDNDLIAINGNKQFLYRNGDFTGKREVSRLGGILRDLLKIPISTTAGLTASTIVRINETATDGYYVAVILSGLTFVKKVEADYAIYKFNVRVCLGLNGYGLTTANAAAVVTRIAAGGAAATDSFGTGITSPFQVITATTFTDVAATTAAITNTSCYYVAATSGGGTTKIVNAAKFWFATDTGLLNTEVGVITTAAC